MKYVFFAFGLLFLTIAVVSANNTRTFVDHASTARGTVIDMVLSQSSDSNSYAPVVRFDTPTGETIEFKSDTSSSPPSYSRGESVTVLYRALAPRDAKIAGFVSLWAGPIMFGGLGSIFFLVGAGTMLAAVLKARKAADLKRNGKRIFTTVERVELNENLKVNGVNPYRVITQWKNPSTATTSVFESDYVWFDPSRFLNGRNIAVFIQQSDPTRYYVDLSFLPDSRALKAK